MPQWMRYVVRRTNMVELFKLSEFFYSFVPSIDSGEPLQTSAGSSTFDVTTWISNESTKSPPLHWVMGKGKGSNTSSIGMAVEPALITLMLSRFQLFLLAAVAMAWINNERCFNKTFRRYIFANEETPQHEPCRDLSPMLRWIRETTRSTKGRKIIRTDRIRESKAVSKIRILCHNALARWTPLSRLVYTKGTGAQAKRFSW